MTSEERRELLRKQYGLDDNKKSTKKAKTKVAKTTNEKSSAAKKVAAGAIAAGAITLVAGGIKATVESYQQGNDEGNKIVFDKDNVAEKTGIDKEIADEAAKISGVQDKLTKAAETLSGIDNKVLATEERAGKYKDMIFDVDGDGREEDFAEQFNNKLASYQERLNEISSIEDETEKAVQFALLKEEMKDIKMILDTNSNENVYANKIGVIQDGYNQNENKAAKASYNHIANLYGEDPVFTYEGDLADIERFADAIVNGTNVDVKLTAFETETKLENGRFVNDESLLNGQEITLDLVNAREQVKTGSKTIYVPVVKPTPTPAPTVKPGPTPGPEVIPDPTPDPTPTPDKNTETQNVVNPKVPVVQTEDQEEKLPETISETPTSQVQPTEETQGNTNKPVGPAVYEGQEPTQNYDFDSVVSVYDDLISSAVEEYAEAEVKNEETQTSDYEDSIDNNQAQPDEETLMD